MLQMLQLMQQQMAQQQHILATLMQQQGLGQSPQLSSEQVMDSLCSHLREFKYDAEAGTTFAAWFSRYEDLFEKDASRLSDDAKVRLLMRKLGALEHDRYTNFILPKNSRDFSLHETVIKLTDLFGTKESLLHRRYKCLNTYKMQEEDYLAYGCRVNRGVVNFDLRKLTEEQLKCLIFVCGLKTHKDLEIRQRLLARIEYRPETTLEQVTAECQRIINLRHDSAMIERETTEKVYAVHHRNQHHRHDIPKRFSTTSNPSSPCWLCGSLHWARDCTYRSHKCTQCGKIGHKEGHCKTCQTRKKNSRQFQRRRMNARTVIVDVHNVQQRRKYVPLSINGICVRLQLDTASDISVIGRKVWKYIGAPPLSPSSVEAKTASGGALALIGEFSANIIIGEKQQRATIYVAQADLRLLGTDLVEAFALWSMPIDQICNVIHTSKTAKYLQQRFPRLFGGDMGLCTMENVTLQLKEQCRPVFCLKRPVAYAMQEAVDRELDRVQKLGVISPVQFSDWVAPIVVVRKIRICRDYSTGLNAALHPQECPLPLPADIFAKLGNCTHFTQIDLSDAFLQVQVAEQSRSLLTINTHRGLFSYNRLPPGTKVATAAFQQLMDKMLVGIHGVSSYMDDIIIGGRNQKEHDEVLKQTLQRIQDSGFTIRAEKCTFNEKQIRYLGHVIDSNGIRPDPAKVAAIIHMPAPSDISGVRSFLGAIIYYGREASLRRPSAHHSPISPTPHNHTPESPQFAYNPRRQRLHRRNGNSASQHRTALQMSTQRRKAQSQL
uniref:Reverse transcriptase domain-containing protein n=1 Tax=Anopheles atroparvus TaxID=41427 RepID=A0AAG5DQM8_ANOAO